MKISIVRGNQVICSSSDEQMTMEDVNAIKRKERMTNKTSTLSVCIYNPNEEASFNPIKLPQNTEKIIEDAKLVAEGKVPGKTVVIDTMPEEVQKAEENTDETEEESEVEETTEETPVEESSVEETSEDTPVMTSGYVAVEGESTDSNNVGFTTVASTDEEVVDDCSSNVETTPVEESEVEETTTEFNVQSKFTQPVEESNTDETEEESEVEETTEETPVEESSDIEEEITKGSTEIVNPPVMSSSSKVIDDFFAKEAREERLYGKKGSKNYNNRPRNGGGGKRGKAYEY